MKCPECQAERAEEYCWKCGQGVTKDNMIQFGKDRIKFALEAKNALSREKSKLAL
jgi:predicted amidophosphoribosyltransferase